MERWKITQGPAGRHDMAVWEEQITIRH